MVSAIDLSRKLVNQSHQSPIPLLQSFLFVDSSKLASAIEQTLTGGPSGRLRLLWSGFISALPFRSFWVNSNASVTLVARDIHVLRYVSKFAKSLFCVASNSSLCAQEKRG